VSLSALREAIAGVLFCPRCTAQLVIEDAETHVRCTACQRIYPIREGIVMFLHGETANQEEERRFRDAVAAEHMQRDREALWEVVSQHHCVPIMLKQAEEFRARLKPHEWILDIGIGWGWHWVEHREGAKIIGVDMSLGNLMIARRLLANQDHRVVLVWADAAALPIRNRAVAGVWSVQVFQHFPQNVFLRVQAELDRVLQDEFVIELYNLNPALLYKIIFRALGKPLQGKIGQLELIRLSAKEWTDAWRKFRDGRVTISHGYSEMFFHPNFRLRPQRYPVRLERVLAERFPRLAAIFARQVQVSVEAQKAGSLVPRLQAPRAGSVTRF